MKNDFKKLYVITLIILLSVAFGYGGCYLINKNKIERNNYDVNNDGEINILDILLIQKYIIAQKEAQNEN